MEGLKVLLVDDDEQLSSLLYRYLENLHVTVVGRARNGKQALAYAQLLEPDLVLLNIRMPGMHGVDIARCLRTTNPLLKIVFLSNNDTYRRLTDKLGFDGFISRHDFLDELPRAIQNAQAGYTTDQRYAVQI